jgi:hypothetical protein
VQEPLRIALTAQFSRLDRRSIGLQFARGVPRSALYDTLRCRSARLGMRCQVVFLQRRRFRVTALFLILVILGRQGNRIFPRVAIAINCDCPKVDMMAEPTVN